MANKETGAIHPITWNLCDYDDFQIKNLDKWLHPNIVKDISLKDSAEWNLAKFCFEYYFHKTKLIV